MLVYGDHGEIVDPRDVLNALGEQLATLGEMRSGIERHGKLAATLIDAGQLLQGVADEGWQADALNEFTWRLAAAYVRSWDSRFNEMGELPRVPSVEMPERVKLRLPEGFAFYCVYPEAYIEAARRLRLSAAPRVIGIRSIGTTLGAVVAATLGAPPPLTVRPFGDPFARQVELPPEIDRNAHYVVVDEGPGLSGSSFGSVADALQGRGVPIDLIAFLPSHGDDLGPQASDAHRARWAEAQRVPAGFDWTWLAELFGPLDEIAGPDRSARRKFLGTRAGERVILKFAGLGAIGERKFQMARALHAAGFTAEPQGFVHGFLVERWHDDALRLAPEEKPIEEIGRYLGARARLFPAGEESGASIDDLIVMCRRNISLGLGGEACRLLDPFDAEALQRRVRRVRTDNKLDRHKWLRLPDGGLLKLGAVDHHQGHDLIGCQDLAWDLAGTVVEFALDPAECASLVSATRCAVDPHLLDFCLVAYSSFRLGSAVLAMQTSGTAEDAAERYRRALGLLLDQHSCHATRQESLVD